MNSEVDRKSVGLDADSEDFDDIDQDDDDDVVDDIDDETNDNVGDVSVEINVEELIAHIENDKDQDAARKKEIRRRLEEIAESKSLEDTYAVEFGDDD